MSSCAATAKKRPADVNVGLSVSSSSTGGHQQPNKKPRKKPITAKSLGLTQQEFNRIKSPAIKKELKAIVKKLAYQVDADWHDGYEEQAETKARWFDALQEPLQAVLDIGVGKSTALLQCNEILKIVADSYYDLLACPCRCDTKEELSDMDKEFTLKLPWGKSETICMRSGNVYDAWGYVWIALLRVHATLDGTDTNTLLRCIKDAHDNLDGAETIKLPGTLYDNEGKYEDEPKDGKNSPSGDKLEQVWEENKPEWTTLPTTKKTHRMRRAIDRRFDGSPDRRTRHFDSDDEGGDCVIS